MSLEENIWRQLETANSSEPDQQLFECRHCGQQSTQPTAWCRSCGSVEIARYEFRNRGERDARETI